MPSNHVLINNSMEFIVVDSKMNNFLRWLRRNGRAVETGIIKKNCDETVLPSSQTVS